ncbi:MAG: hypothetical protein Q8J65_07560 [Nitrosomonadales bacterium]|nr:hypothetical protein [Nitrosomonadales bacterium]
MYEILSGLASKVSDPFARKVAAISMRTAGVFCSARPLPDLGRRVMGLWFPSPLGLAAGFDKNGDLFSALPGLGFGFGEIGSVTPLPEYKRSPGLEATAYYLSRIRAPRPIPLGVSISMNRKTPFSKIPQDYLDGLAGVWECADYITLNLGVRAGPDLHATEHRALLHKVFNVIKIEQSRLASASGYCVPVIVKIDQTRGDTENLIRCVRDYGFNGLVLSGAGNIQGLALLERVSLALQDAMPIISVGGISTAQDARDGLNAGAALLQIYSGLIKSGPLIVQRINQALMTNDFTH